jgi:hypothetical protein
MPTETQNVELATATLLVETGNRVRFLSVLCLGVWAAAPQASAQTPAQLAIQTYAGLSIAGAGGVGVCVPRVDFDAVRLWR